MLRLYVSDVDPAWGASRSRLHDIKMSINLQHWVDRIRAGDVRALARAISTIEDNRPESRELLKAIFNFTGRARVIGLTGAPGAGKSTLRSEERRVGKECRSR